MVDWTKPIEAVHEDGRVVPVTFGRDDETSFLPMYVIGNIPDPGSVYSDNWFDRQGRRTDAKWRIRNRADEDTVTLKRMTEDEWLRATGMGLTAWAENIGLIKPDPTTLDRFMAANPSADRATAELALAWEDK